MFRKGLLFMLLTANLFANNCFAQDLYFEKITGQEIDPSTPIYGIAKDTIGYLWFGSWNGVYRYDGKSFDYYYHKINDKASLPNNRIRNIVFDKKNGLWFLTFDRKYAKYSYQLNSFSIVGSKNVPAIIIKKLNSSSGTLNKHKIIKGKRYSLSSNLFTEQDIKTGKKINILPMSISQENYWMTI